VFIGFVAVLALGGAARVGVLTGVGEARSGFPAHHVAAVLVLGAGHQRTHGIVATAAGACDSPNSASDPALRWQPVVVCALKLLHQTTSTAHVGLVLQQIHHASGGLATAVNSVGSPPWHYGLTGVIPRVFHAFGDPQLSGGILDPLANVYAWLHFELTQGIFATPATGTNLLAQGAAVDSGYLVAASCASATFCMALGNTSAYVFDGRHWIPARSALPNGAGIDTNSGPGLGTFGGDSVSCASASMCVTIDTTGHTLVWNGSTWGAPVATFPGALGGAAVSCATVSFCLAVASPGKADTESAAVFNGASWSAPVRTGVPHRLESLTCVAARLCMATDSRGNLLVDHAANWTIPNLPFQGKASAVSCATQAFCMAVGGLNDAWTFNGHSWTGPHRYSNGPDEISTVSCPNSSFCVVAGTAFVAQTPIHIAIDNNRHWTNATTTFTVPSGLSALTCPTTSFCVAVDPTSGPNPDDVWWTPIP